MSTIQKPKTKVCSKCGKRKRLDRFDKAAGYKHGVNSRCKECRAEYSRQNYRERTANYTQEDWNKEWERSRDRKFKTLYGLTAEQYDTMLEKQGGVCAICGEEETYVHPHSQKPARLAVDHDHETNEVRGLLCAACNNGLGRFRDDPERLLAAYWYLVERA